MRLEKRQVIAELGRTFNENSGLLIPLFKVNSGRELEPILNRESEFPNNGQIINVSGHESLVEKFQPRNALFLVDYDESNQWNELDSLKSKYSTNENWIDEKLTPFLITTIVRGSYPSDASDVGLRAVANRYPQPRSFLRCFKDDGEEVLIGPLEIEHGSVNKTDDGLYEFEYRAMNRQMSGEWANLNSASHSAMEFPISLIPNGLIVSVGGNEFLINAHLNTLPFSAATTIDLSSRDQLIKWASNLIRKDKEVSQEHLSIFKNVLGKIPEDSVPPEIFAERIDRLKKAPNLIAQIEDASNIVGGFLNSQSDEAKTAIHNYVESNKHELLQNIFKEEYVSKVNQAKDEADRDTEKQRMLRLEVTSLEARKNELASQVEEIELRERKDALAEVNTAIDKKREELNVVDAVSVLRAEKKRLEDEISSANSFMEEIRAEMNLSTATHKRNLLKWKLELEAVTGNTSDVDANYSKPIFTINETQNVLGDTKLEKQQYALSVVCDRLRQLGRDVEQQDVATLLVASMQNLVVTLAGNPGAGKSSAVSSLSRALGLNELNRFIRVQVQRGWASDREILGFENKLTHMYEPDRFGLYRAFEEMGKESGKYESEHLMVLLDEANLSPIEHYWSGFMGACDDISGFRTPDGKWSLPSGLRFIATVNSDHTTEQFSPRYLDRSPVIYLNSRDVNWTDAVNGTGATQKKDEDGYPALKGFEVFGAEDMESIFGRSKQADLTRDESRLLDNFIEKMPSLKPQRRKVDMIKQFVHRSRGLLSELSNAEQTAIDVAICIFLLPTLNGQGLGFKKQIEGLLELSNQQLLSRTKEQVERIQTNSSFDHFNYFS